MKTVLITIFLILFVFPGFGQNDSALYSFFIAGHTYGQPGVNNIGFHPPFKEKFSYIQNRPEIKFGVLTGDIVSPDPVAQDWDEIDADILELGIPVYFAVGNHDMENRPLFESRYGITYYDFVFRNDLFLVLDPNIDGWSITGTQLNFMQEVVEEYSEEVDNIYVFFHQILWKDYDNQFSYIRWNSSAGRGDSVNFWSGVMPVFQSLSNQVYMFAGDLGASWSSDVTYDHFDNITLISSGMGDEDGENFVVVNVEEDKSVSYDLICLSDTNINCLGQLTDYIVVDELSNIDELQRKEISRVMLYPNPASNSVTILTDTKRETKIQLFDLQGRLVFEQLASTQSFLIDISNMSKGIYLVKTHNNSTQSTVKLVIE